MIVIAKLVVILSGMSLHWNCAKNI